MKWESDEYKETPPWIAKAIKIAVVVVLIVAVGFAVLWMAGQKSGVKRTQKVATIDLLPPPPPPPPPPPKEEEPPPPEEKVIEEPKPEDKPQEAPPQQITIAGEAQAGGDSFGIQAGSGGGTTLGGTPDGSGGGAISNAFSDSAYRRYLSSTLTQLLQSDNRLNRLVFTADVNLWMEGRRVTRATIAKSTGNAKTDAVLMAALQGTTVDEAPSGPMRFPQRVVVRGRRGL